MAAMHGQRLKSSEETLTIFERKILARFFGPVNENYLRWTLRHNEELHELLDGPDIVKYVKLNVIAMGWS
jgi:hypothetical protein